MSSLPGMGFNRDGDDLEEVIELNSERSTGDWKIDYFDDGIKCHLKNAAMFSWTIS